MAHPFDIQNILAPTDMSPATVPALRYARLFAERFGATLTVVYCDPIVYPLDGLGPSPFIASTAEQEARLRSDLVAYTRGAIGQQRCELQITAGQPIPAILESARQHDADLIVVGTHLHHGWNRVVLGSVSDGVLYGADCPVLTVAGDGHLRAGQVENVRTIVCPINLTDVAREALHAAGRMAQVFGADLLVVHVVESRSLADATADEQQMQRWIETEMDVQCTYRELVLRGNAAERVLDCAEDAGADLIVVGAQHKLFRNTTVIGTTADRVIRFASCPVLVVPRQAIVVEKERAREMAVVE